MREKYSFDIDSKESSDTTKKIFLTIMNDVQNDKRFLHSTIQDQNIEVLSRVKEVYLNKYEKKQEKKPNVENLNRDKVIFGDRPLISNMMVPEANPYLKKTNEKDLKFERFINERKSEEPQRPSKPLFLQDHQVENQAEGQDDFMRKLSLLQEDRNRVFNEQQPPPSQLSSQLLSQLPSQLPSNASSLQSSSLQSSSHGQQSMLLPLHSPHNHSYTQPPFLTRDSTNFETNTRTKNILLKSEDRNIERYPSRYNFKIDIPCEHLKSIEFSKIIIPWRYLEFPYIILKVNEQLFPFTFKTTFEKSNGGRTFMILKSLYQKEIYEVVDGGKSNHIQLEFIMPQNKDKGEIEDCFKICGVDSCNTSDLIKISLTSEFKLSEFSIDDTIRLDINSIYKIVPQQKDHLDDLNAFLNRSSGHIIRKVCLSDIFIDPPNDTLLTQCLTLFNINNSSSTPISGSIMNLTLQTIIPVKITYS
jgi:hypothetical protein